MSSPPDSVLAGEWAAALVHGRRTVLPARLGEPGPGPEQLQRILLAASAAPDHHDLVPWRFVIVPAQARPALADAFEAALRERDPAATPEQFGKAREKAFRSPLLLLAIARLRDEDPEIPANQRLVSAGCAIQNMLLVGTALGYGSSLTSGKALESRALRSLFQVGADEEALCFVSFGTTVGPRRNRVRATPDHYVSELKP
ncbi:nitroreductase family protein [Ramlibacter monticola]|uniref:Putative NAD(P)H nitroreductase n=1 Tax=Ramlibacter monticola TaxID=1926872 RepID=A0A937CVP1_9BURK|nr:nitroreductase family protein [Ramlibacter monticola]